jgi:hypothetical protein
MWPFKLDVTGTLTACVVITCKNKNMYILYFQIKKILYKYSTLSYKATLIKYLF